ncbi:CLUMA_CG001518, isoform A [Clunio marinus]|uniref:CLUMA_CG001518, isoform A n=1 Tax=Clunio marinus TaxID=568069 RepID=A0A1J1HI57_9DIPT|nr:CLUMA_CG001518, isoform A [Clunio marinus]
MIRTLLGRRKKPLALSNSNQSRSTTEYLSTLPSATAADTSSCIMNVIICCFYQIHKPFKSISLSCG